jgi:hypothetical protein
MPELGLTDAQSPDIAAYLYSLDEEPCLHSQMQNAFWPWPNEKQKKLDGDQFFGIHASNQGRVMLRGRHSG